MTLTIITLLLLLALVFTILAAVRKVDLWPAVFCLVLLEAVRLL